MCGSELLLTRLGCPDCHTELSGTFQPCAFCAMDAAEHEMLLVFLRSRGNMRELERHLDVSYPTARARFDRLLAKLGLEAPVDQPDRLDVLASLARGEIDVSDAFEQLD